MRLARHTLIAALKAGVGESVSTWETSRLARGREELFEHVWRTASQVPGFFSQLSAAAMFSVLVRQNPTLAVEIGSYLGRSTIFLGLTLEMMGGDGKVVSIDPHTGDKYQLAGLGAERLPSAELFAHHVAAVGLKGRIEPILKTSAEAGAEWKNTKKIDFLFIDGWHSYEAVLQDGRAWLPQMTREAVVFFDDYTRYKEVNLAVNELAKEGAFHLWGNSFGMAIGGQTKMPSPAASPLVSMSGAWLPKRLHRLR